MIYIMYLHRSCGQKASQLPELNEMNDLDNEGVDLERERVPWCIEWSWNKTKKNTEKV